MYKRQDKGFDGYGGNKEGARKVGLAIAEAAKKANIEEVVFEMCIRDS